MIEFFAHLVQDTSFWVMLSTFLCFGFIGYKAKAPVVAALDNRAQTIRARLDEAEALRAKAQAILEEYKEKSARAAHEAEDILRNAERRAEALRTQTEAKLADMIARQELLAKNRIGRLQEEAMQSIKNALLVEMTYKITSESGDAPLVPAKIDHSLGEVAKILQK